MAWSKPKYSKRLVNDAGALLVGRANIERITEEETYEIIKNWRDAHSYPLYVMKNLLNRRARKIDSESNVVQRIKRLESIKNKLVLHPVKLSQMQDIGGCRAILKEIEGVNQLIELYKSKGNDITHQLIDQSDYITNPRASGYRGYHLIYSFVGDTIKDYDGLKIEIQIRSQYQHAWATTVEAVDTITKQSLKSNFVNNQWSRFFALMGSAFAIMEGCPLVPDTHEDDIDRLSEEITECEKKLKVRNTLSGFNKYLQIMDRGGMDGKYYILELDFKDQVVKVGTYHDLQVASNYYNKREREIDSDESKNIVMVSAESAEALRRAYPNYYLDTSKFLSLLDVVIRTHEKKKQKRKPPKK